MNGNKERRGYGFLLRGIVHFGASNNFLAFLANKRRAPAYARVSAGTAIWSWCKINTILIVVSIVLGVFNGHNVSLDYISGYYSKRKEFHLCAQSQGY